MMLIAFPFEKENNILKVILPGKRNPRVFTSFSFIDCIFAKATKHEMQM